MQTHRRTRPRGLPAASLLPLGLLAGCACRGAIDGSGLADDPQPPAYAAVAEAWNARIAKLRDIQSRGVIELRWTDEEGREHFEPQVNVDLWVQLPDRTALRCEKLGEVYLWVGSNEDGYWLFDLTGEERVLYLGSHDEPIMAGGHAPMPVMPRVLLDLLGLGTLPAPGGPGEPAVTHDRTWNAWQFQYVGRTGPLRVFLDTGTLLPVRVESRTPGGALVLSGTLRDYKRVEIRGVPILAQPRLPSLIDLADAGGGARLKLALDGMSNEHLPQVFDLEQLIRSLRPERQQGELRRSVAATAPVAIIEP